MTSQCSHRECPWQINASANVFIHQVPRSNANYWPPSTDTQHLLMKQIHAFWGANWLSLTWRNVHPHRVCYGNFNEPYSKRYGIERVEIFFMRNERPDDHSSPLYCMKLTKLIVISYQGHNFEFFTSRGWKRGELLFSHEAKPRG